MIRLSIIKRQSMARMVLPLTFVVALMLLMVGRADSGVSDRMRMWLADGLAPFYRVMSTPIEHVNAFVTEVQALWSLRSENAALRADNEVLRQWQASALALEAENRALKAQLGWIPEIAGRFTTGRVVADFGGVYARAMLLAVVPGHSVTKGQVALDGRGVVGRVTEVGSRSARILLLTDINSRLPVTLESSRSRALLVGTNGERPRLLHWIQGVTPTEGERVVTSADAGVVPAGLPVGVVRYAANGVPEVEPLARLNRLDVVRLFDYGMQGILPPEAIARPEPRGAGRR